MGKIQRTTTSVRNSKCDQFCIFLFTMPSMPSHPRIISQPKTQHPTSNASRTAQDCNRTKKKKKKRLVTPCFIRIGQTWARRRRTEEPGENRQSCLLLGGENGIMFTHVPYHTGNLVKPRSGGISRQGEYGEISRDCCNEYSGVDQVNIEWVPGKQHWRKNLWPGCRLAAPKYAPEVLV